MNPTRASQLAYFSDDIKVYQYNTNNSYKLEIFVKTSQAW